jgi:hypothetical protein
VKRLMSVSGPKRTSLGTVSMSAFHSGAARRSGMSAFDPHQTSATQFCCDDCLPALFVLAQIWMVLIVRFSISSRTCA